MAVIEVSPLSLEHRKSGARAWLSWQRTWHEKGGWLESDFVMKCPFFDSLPFIKVRVAVKLFEGWPFIALISLKRMECLFVRSVIRYSP